MLTDTEPTFALAGAPYLEYLPVVDLSSGRLLGMEALVRWHHPTEGLISPNQLIPHAEASGDIGPLTRWIVMEACEQACHWSPSIQLGVNCTIHQLRRGEVSKAVSDALDRTGFRSGQLTVEVTEDAIVDPAASADLRALSQMGVQLSVDDAGTNWSSFEPFKRNSISTVKIDGSFISGLESNQGINRLVVETVIHMAHSLGMSAIVESVETAEQVAIVRAFNADAAQGFFFARPMSSDDAAAMAGGDVIPQFSRTHIRTLVRPGDESHEPVVTNDAGDDAEMDFDAVDGGTVADALDDTIVESAVVDSQPVGSDTSGDTVVGSDTSGDTVVDDTLADSNVVDDAAADCAAVDDDQERGADVGGTGPVDDPSPDPGRDQVDDPGPVPADAD